MRIHYSASRFRFCFLRLQPLYSFPFAYKLSCQKVKIDNQIDFVMMIIKLAKKYGNNEVFIEMFTQTIESICYRKRNEKKGEEAKQVQCI